jgi:hypothetical protein
VTELLGDGENAALGVTPADGHELSFVVHVDHNLGSLVEDAFGRRLRHRSPARRAVRLGARAGRRP